VKPVTVSVAVLNRGKDNREYYDLILRRARETGDGKLKTVDG